MGNFYFDESIHDNAGFIIGAYVYSDKNISDLIFSALEKVGLVPKEDEFKSSILMSNNTVYTELRKKLKKILQYTQIGLVVLPSKNRKDLGGEALKCLQKIIQANSLSGERHDVYFDEGISFPLGEENIIESCNLEIHKGQDSKQVAGIQLADLVAHTLSTMLLEKLGHVNKKFSVLYKDSGYPDGTEINLGFELWTCIRQLFFSSSITVEDVENKDQLEAFTVNVTDFGLLISELCNEELTSQIQELFGEQYLGCIH